MKLILSFLAFFIFSYSSAQIVNENLLLYYPFDGNAEDVSGNDYHADEHEVVYVEDRNGNPESAIYFNGIDSFIDFPNLPELKPDLPVSFVFWVKYDSDLYTDRELFNTSFEEDISSGVFFNSQQATGRFTISFGDGSSNYTSSTRRSYTTNKSIETGEWTNIVAVVESPTNMKIYVNCRDFGGSYSGTGGELFYSNTPGSLGRHDRELNFPANYFKGSLDEFRYWDKALSTFEIKSICDSNLNLSTIDLESSIKLFPNPANDFFMIVSPVTFDKTFVYDTTGKLILSNKYSEKQDITGLKSGVYIVSLMSSEFIMQKRLIVK